MLPTLDQYCNDKDIAGSFENQILYEMCKKKPSHKCAYVTAGKITAIGRIYAASPTRGAGVAKLGRIPLLRAIGEQLVSSELDEKLASIDLTWRFSDDSCVKNVVEIHQWLVETIVEITKQWPANRKNNNWKPRSQPSFASKYLHFHRPNAFPIMDSFAKAGLNCVGEAGAFATYERFCEAFTSFAQKQGGHWTPRSIDTELVRRGRIHKYNKKATCKCCECSRKKRS